MSKGMEKKAKQDREVAEGRWAWKFAGVVWKVRGVLWWWTWFLEMSICGLGKSLFVQYKNESGLISGS